MGEKNLNRTRRVCLRFTAAEYALMEKRYKATTCRKMSDYLRKCLFNKPVTTNYRNQSADEAMIEIIRLRGELNALGNNFNQVVKKLHTLQYSPELPRWIRTAENDRAVLLVKVEAIFKSVQILAEKWLQS